MMALKCDNCGGYFDVNDDVNTMRLLNKDTTGKVGRVKGIYAKDICPACLAAIMKALDDRKHRAEDPMEDDLK